MSWSLNVAKVAKDEFSAAVDAAEVSGQKLPDGSGNEPGVDEDVATAKELLKRLAARSESPFLSGNAGGHALQPGQGAGWSNSVNAYVSSFDAEPEQVAPAEAPPAETPADPPAEELAPE